MRSRLLLLTCMLSAPALLLLALCRRICNQAGACDRACGICNVPEVVGSELELYAYRPVPPPKLAPASTATSSSSSSSEGCVREGNVTTCGAVVLRKLRRDAAEACCHCGGGIWSEYNVCTDEPFGWTDTHGDSCHDYAARKYCECSAERPRLSSLSLPPPYLYLSFSHCLHVHTPLTVTSREFGVELIAGLGAAHTPGDRAGEYGTGWADAQGAGSLFSSLANSAHSPWEAVVLESHAAGGGAPFVGTATASVLWQLDVGTDVTGKNDLASDRQIEVAVALLPVSHSNVQIDGHFVTARCGFETVRASQGSSFTTGRWYYEIAVASAECCVQIGFVVDGFQASASNGVGDDPHSWAYDGNRQYRWHDGGTTVRMGGASYGRLGTSSARWWTSTKAPSLSPGTADGSAPHSPSTASTPGR